ncbi:hypothetical protein EC991_002270 [Linnemannia zychae]|nr:hypothetical protein EC991_002270 [Linnemannia zychae]
MLGQQRFIQKPSDRWFDQEEREPDFNVMSPTGRNRPFKGIHMPRNGHWESPQAAIGSTISSGWSRSEDGISYVYHKGPAGQTPFPTLIAMPGYFPQSTQSPTTQQQQQQHQQQSAYIHAYGPPSPQSNAGPQRSHSSQQISQQQQMPYPSPPAQMNEDDKGLDFWKRVYPHPTTSTAVVTGSE